MTQTPPRDPDEQVAADQDRFRWTAPLVPLEPDEVFIPATVEEMMAGKTGQVVKESELRPEQP
jgi:hypothetical protein